MNILSLYQDLRAAVDGAVSSPKNRGVAIDAKVRINRALNQRVSDGSISKDILYDVMDGFEAREATGDDQVFMRIGSNIGHYLDKKMREKYSQ